MRQIAAFLVATLVALALVAASRVPLSHARDGEALLRLAWTARPERIEQCRTLGDAELAEIPAHMRQRVVCEGVTARYRIDVLRNGRRLATDVLRGGGLRNDRQLYHFLELPVPAGRGDFEVRVSRLDSATVEPPVTTPLAGRQDETTPAGAAVAPPMAPMARSERDERSRRIADEIPPRLLLRETVTLQPREVLLVTYDRAGRRLSIVRGGRDTL